MEEEEQRAQVQRGGWERARAERGRLFDRREERAWLLERGVRRNTAPADKLLASGCCPVWAFTYSLNLAVA